MKSVKLWDIYKINMQKLVAVLCINNKLQEGKVKKNYHSIKSNKILEISL